MVKFKRSLYRLDKGVCMSKEELEALDTLLKYITLDGWEYKDSERLTNILFDYVWGLYSTGSEPK